MHWLYRSVEGVLIAALWVISSARRKIRYRKAAQVILLVALAGTVVLGLFTNKETETGGRKRPAAADSNMLPVMEILAIALAAPLVLLAVITHEISHGWVALQLGDPTAKDRGRLTFNPLKHMSFKWTLLFPITTFYLFRVALIMPKPVPINPRNFENPRRDIMWVGMAGPAVNIFFMLFFAAILRSGIVPAEGVGSAIRFLLTVLIIINMILATFNLLPVPPLDGSRLLIGLLPPKQGNFLIRAQRVGLGLIFAGVIGVAVFVGIDRVFVPWIEFVWRILGLDVAELRNMLAE